MTPPDASCVDAMSSPDFLTGQDIQATSSISRLDTDALVQDRDPLQIVIARIDTPDLRGDPRLCGDLRSAVGGRRRGDAPGGLVLVAASRPP